MKLLVVGGGGREHAIIRSLKKDPEVTKIYACPGNGGIAMDAECVAIGATDIEKIVSFAVHIDNKGTKLVELKVPGRFDGAAFHLAAVADLEIEYWPAGVVAGRTAAVLRQLHRLIGLLSRKVKIKLLLRFVFEA